MGEWNDGECVACERNVKFGEPVVEYYEQNLAVKLIRPLKPQNVTLTNVNGLMPMIDA